jgi:hypothetical protein
VHVLDHERHAGGGPSRHRGEQVRHPGEQPLSAPLAVLASRGGAGAGHLWEQPPDLVPHIPRSGIQRRGQQPARRHLTELGERVRDRQQRQRAGQRQALAPDHHHPGRLGPGYPLPDKPGLAHPGVAYHQHQPGIAAQRAKQPRQLTLSADKARLAGHALQPTRPGRTGQ